MSRTTTSQQPRPKPPKERGPWYGPRAAGEYLELSRASIYLLMKDGKLRYKMHGNRRRIAQSELDDYMARRTP